MIIRKAKEDEINCIMKVYAAARQYMEENGNGNQWGKTHPPKNLIIDDIKKQQLFVGVWDDNKIHCVFALISGEDSTYQTITDGEWLNDEIYCTIHRIASDGQYHGVFKKCIDYCKQKCNNLRIDTHQNNATMHYQLKKYGFIRCGIIYLENGDPRVAYQFTK